MSSNTKILILIFVIVAGLFGVWWLYEGDDFGYDFSTSRDDESIEKLETVSSSDEMGAIEKDLNESDYSNLTRELDSIEAEFEAGIAQ